MPRTIAINPADFGKLLAFSQAEGATNSFDLALRIDKSIAGGFVQWIADETHYTIERRLGFRWNQSSHRFEDRENWLGKGYGNIRDRVLVAAVRRAREYFERPDNGTLRTSLLPYL